MRSWWLFISPRWSGNTLAYGLVSLRRFKKVEEGVRRYDTLLTPSVFLLNPLSETEEALPQQPLLLPRKILVRNNTTIPQFSQALNLRE